MGKKKPTDDVLRNQRPKRRRRSFNTAKIILFLVLFLSVIVGVGFVGSRLSRPALELARSLRPQAIANWHITISHKPANFPKSSYTEAEVEKTVHDLVSSTVLFGHYSELADLAQRIQRHFSSKQVHTIRTGRDRLQIVVVHRVPSMLIELDHLRFLSQEGEVYGLAQASDTSLVRFKGLPQGELQMDEEQGQVQLTAEQRELITEALLLSGLARARKLAHSEITYEQHRGFALRTAGGALTVVFGHKPFGEKFRNLTKIEERIARENRRVSRIELDYDDKAFIR